MSLSRATGKSLIKSVGVYENLELMVKRAVDADRPTLVKSLPKNREKLDEAFQNLYIDFKAYKKDVNVTDEDFNAVDNEVNKFEYNDNWFTGLRDEYYELIEKSDEVLEGTENLSGAKDGEETKARFELETSAKLKQDEKLVSQYSSQIESLTKSISSSVDKVATEINKMSDGTENVARIDAFKKDLAMLDEKIDVRFQNIFNQFICLLEDHEVKEKELMRDNFVNLEKAKIDNLIVMLNQKIREVPAATSVRSLEKKGDQTFLKKIEPPEFKGDIVEYADFVRKWKAQVGKANLSAESELDRLRDHVPAQASKSLYGETTMAGAWKVLDKLYGDKDLVANKLKTQLKAIKPRGKKDPDIVIDLVTEVNNISLRLKTLNMEQILHVDNEFLSAVFRVLPSTSQLEWLKFEKSAYTSKWNAFMVFLDQSRDQALQTKVLLSSYQVSESEESSDCRRCGSSNHKTKKCTVRANAVIATGAGSDDESDDKRKKKLMKKQKEECGKCPLCSHYHTYTKWQDKEECPSDRMFKCDNFQKMTIKERAAALEKFSCCAKCTSWNHKKSDCKSARKCSNTVNGKTCYGEHSSMVCGSGSAYCGSVKVSRASLKSSESSSTSSMASSVSLDSSSLSSSLDSSVDSTLSSSCSSDGCFPDIFAETVLLFQDIKVLCAEDARSCWDNGSTRVLVTHGYARRNNLQSQPIVFSLDVVASDKGVPQEGVLYLLTLVTNAGIEKKIWGFGVDKIMEPPDPTDLSLIRHLFPHLPASVFAPPEQKPVDLLIGNNFLGLHPDGGQGRDAVGDLRALQSKFGLGWVIAGTHPLLKSCSSPLTVAAHCIARVNKCQVAPQLLPSFWESDSLGVLPPKKCNKCLSCSNCSDPALILSRKDQEELDELKKNTKLLDDGIHVRYVFKKDPKCLPNNRSTVVKIAARQEQRLLKTGHLEFYNQEIQKYIDRGAAVKLSKEEIAEWKGPVTYISHMVWKEILPLPPLG